jgi:hypothetical protein
VRPLDDVVDDVNRRGIGVGAQLLLHPAIDPPLREWHHDPQHFGEVQPGGRDALQVGDVGVVARSVANAHRVEAVCDRLRHRAGRVCLERRDQQIHRRSRMLRELRPDVAQHRRILQLPAVVRRAEQDEIDDRT